MNEVIDVAFSPTVKAIQERKGSRDSYANMAARGAWTDLLNDDVNTFISQQRSCYLGTVSADGQPYIQHRGGPEGFLKVLDAHTIAFVDFKGNRQYISQANLQDNAKACLFLMDYATRTRLKIWGEARVEENDEALSSKLMPENYKAKPEQIIIFTVTLWDFNCRAHIPTKIDLEDAEEAIRLRDQRIIELEAEIKNLNESHGRIAKTQ